MAAGDKEKITKQFILDRLEDHEADLSACGIIAFPTKELVSGSRGELSAATRFLIELTKILKVIFT